MAFTSLTVAGDIDAGGYAIILGSFAKLSALSIRNALNVTTGVFAEVTVKESASMKALNITGGGYCDGMVFNATTGVPRNNKGDCTSGAKRCGSKGAPLPPACCPKDSCDNRFFGTAADVCVDSGGREVDSGASYCFTGNLTAGNLTTTDAAGLANLSSYTLFHAAAATFGGTLQVNDGLAVLYVDSDVSIGGTLTVASDSSATFGGALSVPTGAYLAPGLRGKSRGGELIVGSSMTVGLLYGYPLSTATVGGALTVTTTNGIYLREGASINVTKDVTSSGKVMLKQNASAFIGGNLNAQGSVLVQNWAQTQQASSLHVAGAVNIQDSETTSFEADGASVDIKGELLTSGNVVLSGVFAKAPDGDEQKILGFLTMPGGIITGGDLQINWYAAGNTLEECFSDAKNNPLEDDPKCWGSRAQVVLGKLQVAGKADSTAPTAWNVTGSAQISTTVTLDAYNSMTVGGSAYFGDLYVSSFAKVSTQALLKTSAVHSTVCHNCSMTEQLPSDGDDTAAPGYGSNLSTSELNCTGTLLLGEGGLLHATSNVTAPEVILGSGFSTTVGYLTTGKFTIADYASLTIGTADVSGDLKIGLGCTITATRIRVGGALTLGHGTTIQSASVAAKSLSLSYAASLSTSALSVPGNVTLLQASVLDLGAAAVQTRVGSLFMATWATLRTNGSVRVDDQLTLHPNFFTRCPGDAIDVAAGDGLTGDAGEIRGVCPWGVCPPAPPGCQGYEACFVPCEDAVTPADACTIDTAMSPGSTPANAAPWLVSLLRNRCIVGPDGKNPFNKATTDMAEARGQTHGSSAVAMRAAPVAAAAASPCSRCGFYQHPINKLSLAPVNASSPCYPSDHKAMVPPCSPNNWTAVPLGSVGTAAGCYDLATANAKGLPISPAMRANPTQCFVSSALGGYPCFAEPKMLGKIDVIQTKFDPESLINHDDSSLRTWYGFNHPQDASYGHFTQGVPTPC